MTHSDLTAATAAEHHNDLLRRRAAGAQAPLPGHHPPGHARHRDALCRFLTRLSPHSCFQRFFGGGFAPPTRCSTTCCARRLGRRDGRRGRRPDRRRRKGPARGTPAAADLAVAVDEDYRRQGVATGLVHAIVADAASRGIQTLEASVLANNDATHRLVRRLWPGTTSIVDHDVVEYRLPLAQVTTVRAPLLLRAATSADRTALRPFLRACQARPAYRRFLSPGLPARKRAHPRPA
jgi:GNAT superfamily N-acetyltransferase